MQKIDKDKFINDIKKDLNIKPREETYFTNYEKYDICSFDETAKIFVKIFKDRKIEKEKFENLNNIYVKCKLKEQEAINGCKKIVKYKKYNENGKRENCKIELKFPKGIMNSQKVLLKDEGNISDGKRGNLVINVKINKKENYKYDCIKKFIKK